MNRMNRRDFIGQNILAGLAAATIGPARQGMAETRESNSPNEKLRCAVIGVNQRGRAHALYYAARRDCEIAYICDVDAAVGAKVAGEVAARQGREPRVAADMRRIFEDRSVDVVSIATPNHWHALAGIWAMQAGKDVYLEKPVSHNVVEGRRLVEVARKYGRICQAGTQHRSSGAAAAAIQCIREGKLGKIDWAHGIIYKRRPSIGPPGNYPTPAGVDYDLWLGPASMAPIVRRRFHYDWNWFWDYGNGDSVNNGVHALDMIRWALDLKGLGQAVTSCGGRVGYKDAGQTPNTQITIHDFGPQTVVLEVRGLETTPPRIPAAVIIHGSEGIMGLCFASGNTALYDPQGKEVRRFDGEYADHFGNFLDAVRSRKRENLKAEILEGHLSSAVGHMGNISQRLGQPASPEEIAKHIASRKLSDALAETFDRVRGHLADNRVDIVETPLTCGPWLEIDSEKESFVDNPAADAMLTRTYRPPFAVPEVHNI
ncbi:MAG: Gfo/Idh/MocA family oxidoreductase [Pirellulaceae bacterium]|nr:Gfo/Idh/MocA family oxidoreductase [Pirellulaceae bacterium]